jgi:hypothetical protein
MEKFPKGEWWLKNKRNSKTWKTQTKGRKLGSYYMKLLEDGLTQNGVEGVCDVHLKHHLIRMDI